MRISTLAAMAIAGLALSAAPAAHSAPTPTAVWGTPGPGSSQFNNPRGLAVDAAGNVYVADQANHRIQKFTPTGGFLDEWGGAGTDEGEFGNPRGVAVGPSGDVYVADTNNHRVQQFTSAGTFIRTWGFGVDDGSPVFQTCTSGCQAGGGGSGPEMLGLAGLEEVAADSAGNVYSGGGGGVAKFDATGNFLTSWGTPGSDPGEFNLAAGFGIDPAGNVYVADVLNNNVQKFDSAGNLLDAITGLNAPFDVTADLAGNVYVADTGNNRIAQFDPSGNFLDQWGTFGTAQGQFGSPIGVVATGCPVTVYVAELDNDRIQRFDNAGNTSCPPPPPSGGPPSAQPPKKCRKGQKRMRVKGKVKCVKKRRKRGERSKR